MILVIITAAGLAIPHFEGKPQVPSEDETRAMAVALAHTGGTEVTETETGDDGVAYDIEVEMPDGSRVEVELDEQFRVIRTEREDDDHRG